MRRRRSAGGLSRGSCSPRRCHSNRSAGRRCRCCRCSRIAHLGTPGGFHPGSFRRRSIRRLGSRRPPGLASRRSRLGRNRPWGRPSRRLSDSGYNRTGSGGNGFRRICRRGKRRRCICLSHSTPHRSTLHLPCSNVPPGGRRSSVLSLGRPLLRAQSDSTAGWLSHRGARTRSKLDRSRRTADERGRSTPRRSCKLLTRDSNGVSRAKSRCRSARSSLRGAGTASQMVHNIRGSSRCIRPRSIARGRHHSSRSGSRSRRPCICARPGSTARSPDSSTASRCNSFEVERTGRLHIPPPMRPG